MNEEMIYNDGNVTITTTKIAFRGKTYFPKNIASVQVSMNPNVIAYLMLFIGIVLNFFGIIIFPITPICILIGLALIALAVFWGFRFYFLVLDTSGGSVQAYMGKLDYLYTLKEKVEESISKQK